MAELTQEIIDGIKILHFSGSLTSEGVMQVERAYRTATEVNGVRAVVDVTNVEAITTPAITLFLSTVKSVEANGGRLIFYGAKGITAQIITRCKLGPILHLTSSIDEAVKAAQA
jgi:anti-anti-sigma factor